MSDAIHGRRDYCGIPFTFQDGQKLFDVVNQDVTNQTNAGYTQMDLASFIKG